MSEPLAQVLATYGAGLDALRDLLDRLERVSEAQRDAGRDDDLARLQRHIDERDRLTASLVALEADLAPHRRRLSAALPDASRLPGFTRIVECHQRTQAQVVRVLGTDESTLAALRDAETARRLSAQALDAGEHTLAAYRRVVSPSRHAPALIDTDA